MKKTTLHASESTLDLILSPFTKFVNSQSAGGVLLFATTIIAFIWANSSYGSTYHDLWNYEIGISSSHFSLVKPLILWINDGLMAIFFFMIGLEIKRELLIGELDSIKKASLPLFAAIGGMTVPLFLFLILNQNPETTPGWGIPTATDIAFSLAILQILGKRVPIGLKVFLTAFAIVDDLGAVIIIAIFYSESIQWHLLAIAFAPLLLLYYLSYKGAFNKYFHFSMGVIIWYLFLKSGIHPTIAGVLLAFSVPVRQKLNFDQFNKKLETHLHRLENCRRDSSPILNKVQMMHINDINELTVKVYSPLQHFEEKLHSWVGFFIMPIFALANAGVVISTDLQLDWVLVMNIAIALLVGKSIGISLFTYLGVKLKLTSLPSKTTPLQIFSVATLAGVGFTMSIFIANLAFQQNPAFIDSAKIGIILGSLVSGLLAIILLRLSIPLSRGENLTNFGK